MHNKKINYNILIQAEKIRYQTDYSSAHWLHQIITSYQCMYPSKTRDAFEEILRIAINSGPKKALEKAKKYNKMSGFPGFPNFLNLDEDEEWNQTKNWVIQNWDFHLKNRFGYFKQGD